MYQANIRDAGPVEVVSQAWYMALDVRLSLTDALDIAAHLASRGTRLHPSTINEEFLLRNRSAHQQGQGRPRLPLDEGRAARHVPVSMAALGAGEPVRPDDVPGYREARGRKAPAKDVREWAAPCPYCHVPAGEPCVTGTGGRLKHRLAHPSREMAVAGA